MFWVCRKWAEILSTLTVNAYSDSFSKEVCLYFRSKYMDNAMFLFQQGRIREILGEHMASASL